VVAEPAKKPELTFGKVAVAAGAAATSAVAGSYLGAAGTVAGAAIGAVVTTVATNLYQRSLDKTRETVLQVVKPGKGDTTVLAEPVDPLATIPLQRTGELVEPVLPAVSRRPWFTRKRIWVTGLTTVIAFVVGLLVITGVEWAKGSPISGGDSGTSVGRVVTGGSGASEEPTSTESPSPTTSEQAPGPGSVEETGGATPTRSPTPSTSTSPTTSAPATGTTGTNPQRSGGAANEG
jgi:hypothetical protein